MKENELWIAIETGGSDGGVSFGLFAGGEARFGRIKARADDLVRELGQLLKANGLALAAVSGVAVSTGPGSLTGLRIGMAAARGLARAIGCAIYEMSLPEAVYYSEKLSAPCRLAIVSGGFLYIRDFVIGERGNGTGTSAELIKLPVQEIDLKEVFKTNVQVYLVDPGPGSVLQSGNLLKELPFEVLNGERNFGKDLIQSARRLASDND
ncbi:MAG: hypothetical protein JSS81_08935 [Acidobacteria bacterium]|nr:hypothetical protein [Acidobacteriota bacterium]